LPIETSKKLVWKKGEDYLIANPPRKSEQWEEWLKEKEKHDDKKESK
tara:strand:- start:270 stop:410 length:141 start_codon:yes stop_codon:yes gene_type:complete